MKDTDYYNKHKVVYNDELTKLDNEVIKTIFQDPNGEESSLLNERVRNILDNDDLNN
jgi:hypothetical protein